MSRSYRIRVRETLRRVIRAGDHVSSQLELLEILPAEQMAELLAQELEKQGFHRSGTRAIRKQREVTVAVELETGAVTVSAESQREVKLASEKEGRAYDDSGPGAREVRQRLKSELQNSLSEQAGEEQSALQKQVTDKLEGQLADVRSDLDRAVNRATAAALKVKASQMGQIKTLTEDPASGSLTIVVEV